jgi:NAD(P)-dependent dehydrogenase (short-subunit alcohol dehydrogenase family)
VNIDWRAGLRVFSDLATATRLPLSKCKQLCRYDKELPKKMPTKRKTMIVTGAAKGIGAGVTNAFLERGYNVVANSLNITVSIFAATDRLAVVGGDIGDPSTAREIASTAIETFGSIDGVVNNAGIFFTKPFTEYTAQDFEKLSGTNLRGYINITQLAVKQMLVQKSGGSVTCLTSAMVEHPIAGINASLPMVTKGGLEAITRSLAMEYAKEGIRFNAVAPGEVNTPMHASDSREFLQSLSPMGEISDIADIVDAIVYLTEARHVTGEVLHVDGGAHNGKW